jgi:hypothetical protein
VVREVISLISPETKKQEEVLSPKEVTKEDHDTCQILSETDTDVNISILFPSLDSRFVCTLKENTITIKLSKDTSREMLLEIKNILEDFSS